MTTDNWAAQLTTRVADQVRAARKNAGLTVAQVADACARLGVAVPKATIHNLETGRRSSVDLAEFLVLAEVLGVPPISLLYPLDAAPAIERLPGQQVPVWDSLAWFTGETRLDAPAPTSSTRHLLDVFREHADALTTALVSTNLARERRQKATIALDPARRQTLLEAAAGYEQLAFDDCRALHDLRTRMRDQGLTPPGLPTELAFIDQDDTTTAEDGA